MPLVRTDVQEGRTPAQPRRIADTVHELARGLQGCGVRPQDPMVSVPPTSEPTGPSVSVGLSS